MINADFYQSYESDVIPFFSSPGTDGFLDVGEGISLNYRVYPREKEIGAAVILPGRADTILKYDELCYLFHELRYSVYMLEHRGQGRSSRMTPDARIGHVDHFRDYVNDLNLFFHQVVRPDTHASTVLFGHSMGGCVATLFAAGHDGPDALILSSPFFKMRRLQYPLWMARLVLSANIAAGRGKQYAPGGGPQNQNMAYEQNTWMRGRNRFAKNMAIHRSSPEYDMGAASNRWALQAITACERIPALAKKIRIPILILQSGDDYIVDSSGQDRFCAQKKNCRLIRFDRAWHEIFSDTDETVSAAAAEISRFL
jgi:lysophospholipase